MFFKNIRTFGVLAVIAFGVSLVNAQVYSPMAPAQVQNVNAVSQGNKIVVTWDKVKDQGSVITGYKIYYGTNSVREDKDADYEHEIEISGGATITYTIENVETGTYYLAVTAIADDGTESNTYSKEIAVNVEIQNPPASTLLQGNVVSTTEEIQTGEESEMTGSGENIENTSSGTVSQIQDVSLEYYGPELPPEERERIMLSSAPTNPTLSAETPTIPQPDTVAPADITALESDLNKLKSEGIVFLTWEKAVDSDADILDQIVYTKKGIEDWDTGISLGKDVEKLDLAVDMNQNYQVKIVTIDKSNNESKGMTISFSTTLAKSGPESIGTVIALIFLMIGGYAFYQKRRAF